MPNLPVWSSIFYYFCGINQLNSTVMNLFVLAGMFGPMEITIIVLVIVLLFGGRKIPELMKGLGQGMKEFKKATSDDDDSTKKDKESLNK